MKGHDRAVVGRYSYLLLATGHVATDDGHIVVVKVEDAGGPEQEAPRTPAGVTVDHVPTELVARAHRHSSSSIGSRLTLPLSPIPSRNGTDDHHGQTQVCRTERRPRAVEFTGPSSNCPTQDGNLHGTEYPKRVTECDESEAVNGVLPKRFRLSPDITTRRGGRAHGLRDEAPPG